MIKSLKNNLGHEVHDINGILRVAETYYKDLFSGGPIHQNIADLFLREISPNEDCQQYIDDLLMPISEDELKDVIFKFLLGKSPGPDGLSIEFYRAMFPVIKNELRQLMNFFLSGERMPAKFKAGIMKQVPKEGPYNEIPNYRPITLMNADYKIFTKIIR